jgi:hypothetical protein
MMGSLGCARRARAMAGARPARGHLVAGAAVHAGHTHITICGGHDLPAPRPGAPRAGPAPDRFALLPLLAVADHRHGDQGVGGHPPQAPRQVRDGGRPAQPADARHQDRAADGQRAVPRRSQGAGDARQVRPQHARRLDRAQPLHPLQLAGRGPDADHQRGCCSAPSACGVGGADGLDPGHRRRHHQRHRPLLGLPQLRGADASTNISPWGILIGGEELHNNHHTYPTSAKFSVKPYEFDIGWLYIRAMEMLGLAKVRKTPPRLALGAVKAVADGKTLEAIIANRYEVMARYAAELRARWLPSWTASRPRPAPNSALGADLRLAKAWLHRDDDKIPQGVKPQLAKPHAGRSPNWPSWWPCARNCASCGRAPTCRPSNWWPTCRPGAARPRQRHCRAAGVLAEAARGARLMPRRLFRQGARRWRARFSWRSPNQRARPVVANEAAGKTKGPRRVSCGRKCQLNLTSAWFPCTARACEPSDRTS